MDFLRQHNIEFTNGPNSYRGLAASQPIQRGTIIFREDAFAIVPLTRDICQFCLLRTEVVVCSRCQRAFYCSQKCQKQDWKQHKQVCKAGLQLMPDTLMLLQVIHQLSKKNAETDQKRDTFLDLVSHLQDLSSKTVAELKGTIANAKDSEFQLDEVEAMAHLAKFRCNNFVVYNPELISVAEGTYPYASLLNHSCTPNCIVLFKGRTLHLRAIADIEPNKELFISYCDPIQALESRKDILKDKYHFECVCDKCLRNLVGISSVHVDHSIVNKEVLAFYNKCYKLNSIKYESERYILLQKLPSSRFDVKQLAIMSKELETRIENGDWKRACDTVPWTVTVYICHYVPFHPLICLQLYLAAKCFWNNGSAREAHEYIRMAISTFEVAYGTEFFELLNDMTTLSAYIVQEL